MLKMVLNALAQNNSSSGNGNDVLFGNIDAENVPELSEKYNVTMVPTVILLLNNNTIDTVWERLEGEVLSDPSHVTLAVQRLIQARTNNEEDDNGGTTSSSSAVSASALSSSKNNNNHDHDP